MADLTSDFLRVVLAVLVGYGDTFLVRRFNRYLKRTQITGKSNQLCRNYYLSRDLMAGRHRYLMTFSMMHGTQGVHAVSLGHLVTNWHWGLHRHFVAHFVGDDFAGRCRVSVISVSAIPSFCLCLGFGLSLGLCFTPPSVTVGSSVGIGIGVVIGGVGFADLLFHGFAFLGIGDFDVGATDFFVAGVALFIRHLFDYRVTLFFGHCFTHFFVFGFVRHFDFRPTFLPKFVFKILNYFWLGIVFYYLTYAQPRNVSWSPPIRILMERIRLIKGL